MSALPQDDGLPVAPIPQIYVASPLTSLTEDSRRQIQSDVYAVRRAVEAVTVTDRIDADSWPVAVHAPIDHTAPWKEDGLTARQVYRKNLDIVHRSDALIVVAENGGSAGVGQELEWATRLGLPVLYLTAGRTISRQIEGAPAFIQPQSYSNDVATLENHVKNFLRQWKPMIVDGPRRRESREIRFLTIAQRLRAAWQGASNRTEIAAQVRVNLDYMEMCLSDPVLISVMPVETLIAFAHELDVSLTSLSPHRVSVLPVPVMRALIAAAEDNAWPDEVVERLVHIGRAAIEAGDAVDLSSKSGWQILRDRER